MFEHGWKINEDRSSMIVVIDIPHFQWQISNADEVCGFAPPLHQQTSPDNMSYSIVTSEMMNVLSKDIVVPKLIGQFVNIDTLNTFENNSLCPIKHVLPLLGAAISSATVAARWVTPVEDSYHQLRSRSGEEMRAKIQVQRRTAVGSEVH